VNKALLLALLLVPARAQVQAQEVRCSGEMTIGQCLELQRRSIRSQRPDARVAVEQEIERKPTGVQLPGSNDVSISDFLSRVSAALLAPGVAEFDKLGTSFNIPLARMLPAALQVGITLHEPKVFKPLLAAVPASRRTAVQERLESEFGELDQPQLSLALNLETRRFGRRFDVHADELAALLLRVDSIVADSLRALHFRRPEDFVLGLTGLNQRMIPAAPPACAAAARLAVQLSCLTPVYRDSLLEQLRLVSGWLELQPAVTQEVLRAVGFHHVADLINNQPQLNFTAQHDAFDRAVGPTRSALQFRLEMGFANLNGARRHCGGTLQLSCFRSYVDQEDLISRLRRGARLWASFDATRQPDYTAPFLASDSAQLSIASSWQWQGELGFGAYLDPDAEGAQESRIDFVASGSARKEDGVHEPSRFIATLNIAHRLSDSFAGSVGVTWANRPELIVDRELRKIGAHIGVRYKLTRSQRL
jgi:hypothetical protein